MLFLILLLLLFVVFLLLLLLLLLGPDNLLVVAATVVVDVAVVVDPRNLPLKFVQNRVINKCDLADVVVLVVEFAVVGGGQWC